MVFGGAGVNDDGVEVAERAEGVQGAAVELGVVEVGSLTYWFMGTLLLWASAMGLLNAIIAAARSSVQSGGRIGIL